MIADEFCLLAHDEQTGRARVHPDSLGVGVAAALLSELLLPPYLVGSGELPFTKHLTVQQGLVGVVAAPPAAPYDALQHWLFELVALEPAPLRVEVWLRWLAREAPRRVVDRMIHHGVAARPEPGQRRAVARLRRGAPVLCRPVDPNWAAYLPGRLRGSLHDPSRLTLPELVLVGLVAATELIHHVVLWDGEQIPAHVEGLLRRLPPPLQELLAHTQASLAAVVLSR